MKININLYPNLFFNHLLSSNLNEIVLLGFHALTLLCIGAKSTLHYGNMLRRGMRLNQTPKYDVNQQSVLSITWP